ncbi:MAG: metallopeptidase [Candidatus Aenigmarchaeota archaeon]|nr:metallopeptidase [Candidatus Aenigmarchaeota archaeon]
MIKYQRAPDIESLVHDVSQKLNLSHDLSRVVCIRSTGSQSRRVLARCHTISRAIQTGLGIKAHYVIEVVSENFDRQSNEEQIKTIIHELMHIPKAFGGGFKGHGYVNRRTVEKLYQTYKHNNNNENSDRKGIFQFR